MKKCKYCDRDNEDNAVRCRDCGTIEFKSIVISPPESEQDIPPPLLSTVENVDSLKLREGREFPERLGSKYLSCEASPEDRGMKRNFPSIDAGASPKTLRTCEFCGSKGATDECRCSECGTVFPEFAGDWQKGLACPHCHGPIRRQGDHSPHHLIGILADGLLPGAGTLTAAAFYRPAKVFYECPQCGPIPWEQFPELIKRRKRFIIFVFFPGIIAIISLSLYVIIYLTR
jgi:hypothetical protein